MADYARGYKPADIARVLKVDRKTVTEILRNRSDTPTICGTGVMGSGRNHRLTYLQERRLQHQGIGRNQKDSWITIGKPRIAKTTIKLIVHSGICNAGIIIWATCSSINAVARYIAALLKTFRFFNSDIKFDIMNNYDRYREI